MDSLALHQRGQQSHVTSLPPPRRQEEGGQCHSADLAGGGRGYPLSERLQLRLRDGVPRPARGGVPRQAERGPRRAVPEEGAAVRHQVSHQPLHILLLSTVAHTFSPLVCQLQLLAHGCDVSHLHNIT